MYLNLLTYNNREQRDAVEDVQALVEYEKHVHEDQKLNELELNVTVKRLKHDSKVLKRWQRVLESLETCFEAKNMFLILKAQFQEALLDDIGDLHCFCVPFFEPSEVLFQLRNDNLPILAYFQFIVQKHPRV